MRRHGRLGRVIIAAALVLAASALQLASGEDTTAGYPNRAVRLIVPFVPGGLPDTIARIVAQRLTEELGQPFVVDNRAGAGGLVGGEIVAKASADGYTLLVADVQHWAIGPAISAHLPYQPHTDLAPVSVLGTASNFLAVNTAVPASSLGELIALVKAHPGKYNYGSSGVGTIHHLTMEMLKAQTGLDLMHVPYKGGGQAVPALVAGDVSMLIQAMPALAGHLKQGTVKLLAVARTQRSAQAPNVPTFAELGVPGMDLPGDIGIMAPARTPTGVVAKLAAELHKAVHHPDTVQRFTALSIDPVGSTTEAYRAVIRSDIEKFGRAAKLAGLKKD